MCPHYGLRLAASLAPCRQFVLKNCSQTASQKSAIYANILKEVERTHLKVLQPDHLFLFLSIHWIPCQAVRSSGRSERVFFTECTRVEASTALYKEGWRSGGGSLLAQQRALRGGVTLENAAHNVHTDAQ
ncbi:hypothetical protein ILYODFUR_019531 [Ilyodon furcidens]|uniref:Uncharacterized protein n=1 Tax=Ilyodon furcidens TaxID=33524 RepID=A0ABV0T9E5_9TELE